MYFLFNLSHYVKSYGHLCQILAFFTMPALQIWPCHVTQEANFETILLFPNSAFNIRKRLKISSRKALYFRSYQPKTSWGVETLPPPVFFGVKGLNYHNFHIFCHVYQLFAFTKKVLHRFISFCISLIFTYCLYVEKKLVMIKHFLSTHLKP